MTDTIFVSYRRDDAAAEANAIAKFVETCTSDSSVFFDTSSITAGEDWPDTLRKQVKLAKIVLVIIGPEWVRVADEWGQRRLDDPTDWVRNEVETALSSNAKLIPVFVKAARMPPSTVLPTSLQDITRKQAIELRRDYWDHDIQLLLAQFTEASESSTTAKSHAGHFPRSPYLPPDPVTEDKLVRILENELSSWSQLSTPLPSTTKKLRQEITREYTFKTFQSTISFMSEVAPGCDIANHHPRWENIWKTLKVSLSTWDGELHKVTDRDVMLAKYFDRAYRDFEGSLK